MPNAETAAQGGGAMTIPRDTSSSGFQSTGDGRGSPGADGGGAVTLPSTPPDGGRPPSQTAQEASPGNAVQGGGTVIPFGGGQVVAAYPQGEQRVTSAPSDTSR